MTIFLTAHKNTKARLIAKEAQFCGVGAAEDADLMVKHWEAKGYLVVKRLED